MNFASGPVVLMPAYGRMYLSSEDAVNDWNNGKDFKVVGAGYCSNRDLGYLKDHCSTAWIAWNRVDQVRVF